MTILPMLDYRDIIYRSAGKGALERLDVLYHSAIRFATNAPYRTHHCTLHSVNWSSLYTRRKTHWLMLIYKTLLGLTPSYLRYLLQLSSSTNNTRSASHILSKVPEAHTSPGCFSFQFAAASDWNELQRNTQLWLPRVMYCCLYLPSLCAVCDQSCLYHVLRCYHVVLPPCCFATMWLSCCVAAMLCCCLRALFM